MSESSHQPHAVPLKVLVGIFAALMLLTFMTVAVTWVDLGGKINLSIALGIAVVKAALVCLYFMHLRWDSPFNGFILIIAMAFVALFIVAVINDTKEYAGNVYEADLIKAAESATP